MIILSISIDNVYMFSDFMIDFTFKRTVNNDIVSGEKLLYAPNINYKKVNIFMGGNATGKTALGRVMCGFQNFICGRNFDDLKHRDDKNKAAKVKVEFVINDMFFEMEVGFDGMDLTESLKVLVLKKSYNLKKVREYMQKNRKVVSRWYKVTKLGELTAGDNILSSIIFEEATVQMIKSTNFSLAFDISTLRDFFRYNVNYLYEFSKFLVEKDRDTNRIEKETISEVLKILKVVEPSVHDIQFSTITNEKGESEEQKDCYIHFLNGEKVLVEEGVPTNIAENRLSQGTIEAIMIANIIAKLKDREGIIYVDEKTAYMHTTLANALTLKMIMALSNDAQMQLFVTTHDENILDLDIPNHSFTFLRRDNHKTFVEYVERTYSRNDRELKDYVHNNYFGTNPEIEELFDAE